MGCFSTKNFDARTEKGGIKILTHKDGKYVGFTLKKTTASTLSKEMLGILIEKKFTHFIPQIRVNSLQLMSPNLGPKDLTEFQGEVRLSQFHNVASELDRLHELNILHRDIKPDNAFIDANGNVVLTDLDMMGRVKTFSATAGTEEYCPPTFFAHKDFKECDNLDQSSPINGYKKDQFALLLTAIAVSFRINPQYFDDYKSSYINEYLQKLNCDNSLKINLQYFLLDTPNHSLTNPLADYFPKSAVNK